MRWLLSMVILVSAVQAVGAEAGPIEIYDLTEALRFDATDSAETARVWDHVHAIATLQGIVNRDAPRLYVRFVRAGGRNVDDYWLDRISEPGQWLEGRSRRAIPSIEELVHNHRQRIRGVVLYDPAVPATSNVASTIAGAEDLIAVRYDPAPDSMYHRLVLSGPQLPVVRRLLHEDGSSMFVGRGTIPGTDQGSTGSAKCDAYRWMQAHYLDTGKVDAAYAAYYLDAYWIDRGVRVLAAPNQHTLTNHDFFVARRGWFFDLHVWPDESPIDDPDQPHGADLRTLEALLRSAWDQAGRDRMIHIGGFTPWAYKYTDHPGAGGKHPPVPTEWEYARIVSSYNAFMDADAIGLAAMANASFWMHFPLKPHYPQPWVSHDQLRQRGYLTDDGQVDFRGRKFILFYVGDWDSAAWVQQQMPVVWDHPDRGTIPLMWSISPILERRAPHVLDYLRRTASPNDYFASANNGAGYLNPGMLQEPRASGLPCGLDLWARHCQPLYDRWGLSITGFVIDGFAPGLNDRGLDAYARFSPNGIVPQKIPPSLLHGNMPVMRADYDLGDSAAKAAATVAQRVRVRQLPFSWFRAILKTPAWYRQVYETARSIDSDIHLLDAPTFFELYRIYLQNHPEAAAGKMPLTRPPGE